MKKLLAMLLALSILFGLCACGGGAAGGDDELSADGKMIVKIGMPNGATVVDLDNNDLTKWIEEECNVELKFEVYDELEAATQVNAAIAARQKLPDILYGIKLGQSTLERYGREGYYVNLAPYLYNEDGSEKTDGPGATFWGRLNNTDGHNIVEVTEAQKGNIVRQVTDLTTGAIYTIPLVETSLIDRMDSQAWINVQWLDKLKLEKPTNSEELYQVLKAFKENDCNGNGDKNDEIPLFGSRNAGFGADVVAWLINLFVYYDETHNWLIDENGKLSPVYLSDAYRDAMIYINKLYEEELLTSLAWSASLTEMKSITTPSDGVPVCGIFTGHLTMHVRSDAMDIVKQYEPLQTWGCAIRNEETVQTGGVINGEISQAKQDKCFEILMKLWSWEGSMRQRYGVPGTHWMEADEGAKSDLGLDAEYKYVKSMGSQHTSTWHKIGCAFNNMAEMETAQAAEAGTQSDWYVMRQSMHAESYRLFAESEKNNNPAKVCPILVYTEDEREEAQHHMTNIGDRYRQAGMEFMMGVKDASNQSVWDAYVKQINDLGHDTHKALAQKAYDRQ